MTTQQKYTWIALLSLFVAAQAFHWLITPIEHSAASNFRVWMVWLQMLGGIGCAAAAWRRSKRAAATHS
jgi:hypothetical protein